MNAAHPHRSGTAQPLAALAEQTDDARLSALLDGELSIAELDDWLLLADDDAMAHLTCQRYQLIGQALRGEPVVAAPVSPQSFLAGVRSRLQEGPLAAPAPTLAATSSVPVHAPAANDAVFRWKLVAGFASLAAVMAVSWNVLGTAAGDAGGVAPGPQMALVSPAGQTGVQVVNSVQTAPPAMPAAVVVNTAQGPVLRDPRLEQLLAEHRQYGGMSALQMPAGFLRDATHQADSQR